MEFPDIIDFIVLDQGRAHDTAKGADARTTQGPQEYLPEGSAKTGRTAYVHANQGAPGPRSMKSGPWVWLPKKLIGDGRRVGHAGILVYMYLALFTKKGIEEAWPSQDTIARGLGMSKSTVRRALKRLSAAGYVVWRYAPGRNARGRLIYTLTDPQAGRMQDGDPKVR